VNGRVAALLLPVSCLIAVVLFALAVPVSVIVMMVMLVKPGIVGQIQRHTEKKITSAIMKRMFSGVSRA
jgi:hypothetical protein